jgi:signal transduction histidine kinase/ActR/RegA family two-component response regulator
MALGKRFMFWSAVDKLAGVDPLLDFDKAVKARVVLAFAIIMSATGLVNAFLLMLSDYSRPGMIALGIIAAVAYIAIGVVGLRVRRPNLAMTAIVLVTCLVMFAAIWGNRGSFSPALAYLPGVVLGVYVGWGLRGAFLMFIPIIAALGLTLYLGYQYAGTDLQFSPQSILVMVVSTSFLACAWSLFLGSSFRSALMDSNAMLAKTNARLTEALQAEEAANRAKVEFLANMGHEIRTPLNGVLGMARVMLNEPSLKAEQIDQLKTINMSGETLLELLNGILDMSKIEGEELELEAVPFDLPELVQSVTSVWAGQAEKKGVLLNTEVNPDMESVLIGDPLRVRQLLNILLSNAVKFTPSGAIRVSVTQDPIDEEGKVETNISVHDTGIGIAQDNLSSIFDTFAQADPTTTRKYGGTGLGLAISGKLAKLMGGQIEVHSSLGEGSEFTLVLRSEVGIKGGLDSHPRAAEPILIDRPVRILIVDDVASNQLVLKAFTEQSITGDIVKIDLASNGREAINLASICAYDIILMDVQMPTMDGTTAMHCIRSKTSSKSANIVAVTAFASVESRRHLVAEGFSDHLAKPVKVPELRRVLAEALPVQSNIVDLSSRTS